MQVDAPGRYGTESDCEIRQIFELENFGPSEPIERFRKMEVEKPLQRHRVVSRDEWLKERKAHLIKEKELTRQRDQLSKERRALPG